MPSVSWPERPGRSPTQWKRGSLSASGSRPIATGRIALVGGRVVTMRDAERRQEIIETGVVIVRGNRIEAVGSVQDVRFPPTRR